MVFQRYHKCLNQLLDLRLCSVRLTGTSSCTTSIVSWGLLPAGCPRIPAKKRTKRRPSGRVRSDAQVSQQETPKNCQPTYLSTACGTLKVVKELCICVCVVSFRQNILQSLVRNLKARASNQRVSRKFAKGSNPFSDIPSAI